MVAGTYAQGHSFWCNEQSAPNGSPMAVDGAATTVDTCRNRACSPCRPISIEFPANTKPSSFLRPIEVIAAKSIDDSWQQSGQVRVDVEPNRLIVSGGIKEPGFYTLRIPLETRGGRSSDLETYIIVCDNWKSDLLAFCREMINETESNRDPQLMFASIAASHFNHTMEIASSSFLLSQRVLRALADAMQSKKTFEAGRCPSLVVGLNKIMLKRFEGATVAEFVVVVPENYDSSRKWPVLLYPDPKRFYASREYSQRSGLIDIWWPLSGFEEFEWKDYQCFRNVLASKLNLDEDRFYLHGHCGNGIPTMALALNYPDQWAECSILLGNSYRHLAGNALNLPVILVASRHEDSDLIAYFEFAVRSFQYYGCRRFKYSRIQEVAQTRGTSIPQAPREKNPQRVLYTIDSLRNPAAYWVTVHGREDENLTATIDASVDGQDILVKTRNIDAYSLDLVQAPVDSNRPTEIFENGRSLGVATREAFTRKPEAYAKASFLKNERLSGPVCDAFTDPYVVVYGAGGQDCEFSRISRKIANSLANGAPCFADVNMPKELLGSHNLILVGTEQSNAWLSKICLDLPVQIKEGQIIADDRRYTGPNTGFILIHPNPLNPEKYVAVFSAMSSSALGGAFQAYSEMKSTMKSSDSTQPSDVGIFEVSTTGEIKWHLIEKFNTLWNWHSDWKKVLATANRKHPKWQWGQWIAKTLRLQLEADVVICEDPFRFSYSMPGGQITYRDLFNNIRNDWIVRITLTGESLRDLLAIRVDNDDDDDDDDDSGELASKVIIDGISFAKLRQDSNEKMLGINDLENSRDYTVALPHQLLNGQRLGIIKDYEIVGEGYLVPLLADSLCKNKGIDIDAKLDSVEFVMF
ncbi:MAG: 5'-nucleotidase C-terminal domain-containing protein [Planctomycetota bacterium]